MATRRSAAQIHADRERIVAYVAAHDYEVRPPSWALPGDVTALAKAGRIKRVVRKEFDRQTGHAANVFRGSGSVVRHRAYLSMP
jgi:hypothetical protein